MIEIIPSINVSTFEEVKERVAKVEPFVRWCHLDVTDGVFSKHKTWNNPADLIKLDTNLNVEVHLMVENPENILDNWLVKPINRVIVHLEAVSDMELIIKKCREADIEIGLAINPETPWERLQPWFEKVDLVQILAVHPGPSGQKPEWQKMLGKITHIRDACSGCMIEVDGGVNPESGRRAVDAGANVLVAGVYIFNSENIENAIKNLSG